MPGWFETTANTAQAAPVVASWFTSGGAVLAGAVSAVVALLVSRRTVYINAVTAERAKWIEAIRGTISKLSASAERIAALKSGKDYADSENQASDFQEFRRLLSDLTLRLNPLEDEAKNLLVAAEALSKAARLHSPAAVMLADRVMTLHAQWVLKAEWERVKLEAAGWTTALSLKLKAKLRNRAYRAFLLNEGSLDRLAAIGAGKKDGELASLLAEISTVSARRSGKIRLRRLRSR